MRDNTDNVVAVQDLRTSLAAIADRAAKGESFLVMRNSRPAFRIVPATSENSRPASAARPVAAFRELRARYQASGLSKAISRDDVEAEIRHVHDERRAGPPANS